MSNEIIAAIVLAVLAKPMDYLWNYIFTNHKLIGSKLKPLGHILIGYGLPIAIIIFGYYKFKYDGYFIALIVSNCFTLLLSFLTDRQKRLIKKYKSLLY